MKSHSCVETGGGVLPSTDPISQAITPCHPATSTPATIPVHATTLTRCRHIDRLGRHCRLLSTIPDLELCPHHARQEQKRQELHNDKSAAELLRDVEDFSTPEAINALLGNLVRQLARKRISRLDALAIAYVSQLLLGSISSMDRHEAALRAAEASDTDDSIPGPLIFDPPTPISDSTKLPVPLSTSESIEGRA